MSATNGTALIRQNFSADCEAAINKQINIELYASYVYLSMSFHFDRADVALPNLAKWFRKQSDEERGHAMTLMTYQNTRGGRVILQNIQKPEKDDWGSAIDAFETALALEKFNNQALLELHSLSSQNNDPQMCDFLEDKYLREQVESIEEIGYFCSKLFYRKIITNLKRVGSGLGEFINVKIIERTCKFILKRMISSTDKQLCTAFDESPPSLVRNVCIIAHVDHGKTTLADYLVSANGIISARLAGKLRYMDCREDEQIRGITMKSSAITLYYDPLLINLIDSPGHIDFCNEVSSAVNLADIAILLVDVVCRRLIIELKMSETEAHKHLQRLIEFINACLSKAIQGQLLEEDWKIFDQIENRMHFNPSKGNVLFASALYGYAFAIEDFAELWAKRLVARQTWQTEKTKKRINVKDEVFELKNQLTQHLFSGDYYFSTKTNKICSEQFVLEPLWEIHKCAFLDKTVDKLNQIATKLSLPNLKSKRGDEAFSELMRNWLPLSSAIVRACAKSCSAQNSYKLTNEDWNRVKDLFEDKSTSLPYTANCLSNCDPNDPLVLSFVSKAFTASDQFQIQRRISLCRVMCGTLRKGDQIFVFKPLFNSKNISQKPLNETNNSNQQIENNINNFWQQYTITSLFILFGRDLLEVERIPCGRICGVEVNNGEWIGGSLICNRKLSHFEIPYMEGFKQGKFADPIVRVTIKPSKSDLTSFAELRSALRQLTVLDSAVSIVEQKENEFLMLTAGEVHLQKCIEDLNSLGQTDLVVSEPIVPFLETLVVPDQRLSYAKILTDQITECFLPQFGLRIRLRAVPLIGQEPDTNKLFELMKQNAQLIDSFSEGIIDSKHLNKIEDFRFELAKQASLSLPKLKGSWWAKKSSTFIQQLFTNNILSFGPTKAKLNILFNNNNIFQFNEDFNNKNDEKIDNSEEKDNKEYICFWKANLSSLEQSLVSGFHIAMAQGPLCDEPMQAIGIIIENWILEEIKENKIIEENNLINNNNEIKEKENKKKKN
ncbi:Tr-type G domain-containing protein [Meloidogyne graminicola]|uniref:Tr-type G domain-containing protein n=1 Tax=Meloidogyne graminicola TaxID=189291 RepID=A0A8S9ZT81_9BILA|nr:Tr-type G domain-containing protein [Meloidogyne graminicola]